MYVMSATRLLLLGTVRLFQPVHGYFVRRELMSWHAETWAHLNPGSVYNGLRTLVREGLLEEAGTEAQGGRPARTSYRLTGDGEAEFLVVLRNDLWGVRAFEPADMMAAWSFAWALTREEVIAALEHRVEQIEGAARANEFAIEDLLRSRTTPDTVAEHYRMTQARLDGEARWARELVERLRAGAYWFDGEPDPPWSSPPAHPNADADAGGAAVREQA
jgi:DNA-binding PadR family transcriptional regulator